MARKRKSTPSEDIRSPVERRDDALAKMVLYRDNVNHGWRARFNVKTVIKVAIIGSMLFGAIVYFFFGLGLLGF